MSCSVGPAHCSRLALRIQYELTDEEYRYEDRIKPLMWLEHKARQCDQPEVEMEAFDQRHRGPDSPPAVKRVLPAYDRYYL